MTTVRSTDGTAVAFEKTGGGPPVILVDGALCYRASGPSRPLAAELSRRFTVFTYDRRGRGESGDRAPYALEREVEDLQALVEQAGASASLYGVSSGAALALEAAARGVGVERLACTSRRSSSTTAAPRSRPTTRLSSTRSWRRTAGATPSGCSCGRWGCRASSSL
jgi:pimeloyl-ACP methyl ester carboxylesterase